MPERVSPKAQLAEHGLQPKRSFGQNFLADAGLAERIAELCGPPGSTVIEIGAGMGALTRPLLERASCVIAVERDRDLVPVLRAELAEFEAAGRLHVLEADAKSLNPVELFEGRARPHVLAGNLPYQITGPLLTLAARSAASLDRAVFLVQLEVAARLTALPSTKEYGALSVFTQAAFDVARAFIVRRGAFYPQPGVDSAVVVFTPKARPTPETPVFVALVHAAFEQRRKKLSNAWRRLSGLPKLDLESLAAAAVVDLDKRGEDLAVTDFERMAEVIQGRS